MALTAIFAAIAVVGSLFSFPVLGSKCAPVQHLVNILCAILVGPWYALADNISLCCGVDADTSSFSDDGVIEKAVIKLAQGLNCLVIASGEIDIVSDEKGLVDFVSGGDVLMSRITGSGCMSSALLGAYMAIVRDEKTKIEPAVECLKHIKKAGENAAVKARLENVGTMTFRNYFIDEIYL